MLRIELYHSTRCADQNVSNHRRALTLPLLVIRNLKNPQIENIWSMKFVVFGPFEYFSLSQDLDIICLLKKTNWPTSLCCVHLNAHNVLPAHRVVEVRYQWMFHNHEEDMLVDVLLFECDLFTDVRWLTILALFIYVLWYTESLKTQH